ncbi:MAG: hydroxyacylglutathione hydrolase [Alphaproteobacteria bacterium]|nr:hydroxyacylglutathione hydrolase [Alphaproteobacteria bacterium]MCB9928136.1 hydroxyacylglutathione hydrolase [Alphaproteobacteria bacterium]
MAALEIVLVPALSDNYVYLLHDADTGDTAVVDPAEAPPVEDALAARGWKLTHILNTHHHMDHIGGDQELKAKWGCPIVGPRAEAARIAGMDVLVSEGDRYAVGTQTAEVFEVPGHTTGHIAFWFKDSDALFCGDTLFALGCGRMFEGNPPGFWNSLLKLRALPDSTRVYCGHEYTQSNARFAVAVDPDNAALKARAAEIDALRAEGKGTIPSLLGQEKAINPFLRADDPALQAAVGMAGADPADVFAEIRKRKDNF